MTNKEFGINSSAGGEKREREREREREFVLCSVINNVVLLLDYLLLLQSLLSFFLIKKKFLMISKFFTSFLFLQDFPQDPQCIL